jgi:tetratricopeptide (TPR) repeat protein
MKKSIVGTTVGGILFVVVFLWAFHQFNDAAAGDKTRGSGSSSDGYTGSKSCRKCHEKFYRLWATSRHGLAMQPYTREFAAKNLTPQTEEIIIRGHHYRADVSGGRGRVLERGPEGDKEYRIDHVMGGKSVYYFLTAMDRGRLQTLPTAYDVKKKEWFDMAKSGVRHIAGRSDEPVNWKEWPYTFNTGCHSCHVSRLSTNYDLKTDTYHTTWLEPGINCETCHGPAEEHIRVCEAAPKGTVPKDLKITRGGRDFSKAQNNALCAGCHAKASLITSTFKPGDKFFDHFGPVTLESPDYYPDGRDLGENYTYTSWLMSPCVKSGKLDCLHCHTSSGRFRFKAKDKVNQACMPCHRDKVDNATKHTRHKAAGPGNECIACHMPTTEFARMRRTDHSMLPPTPAADIAFKSPNACNLCHKDKTPQWADKWVRKRRKRDYQAAVLHRALLIDAARKRDWTRLQEMLGYITSKDRDEIFAASLLKLVPASHDPRIVPTLLRAVKDDSPLVRGAAAEALQNVPGRQAVQVLADATSDEYRLVRVRAAASLARHRNPPVKDAAKKKIEAATKEFLASIQSRPDQWSSHYNLGNYYLDSGDFKRAVESYETALKMEPNAAPVLINEAMAYARMGDNKKAGDSIRKALDIAPGSSAANFNMGLLEAEENDLKAAEGHLKAALDADPQMAPAAYNLCVILSRDRIDEALDYCKKAAEMRPDQPKYVYTLAFYYRRKGDLARASAVLDDLIDRRPGFVNAYLLLGRIREEQGEKLEAEKVFAKGLAAEEIPVRYKGLIRMRLDLLRRSFPDAKKK